MTIDRRGSTVKITVITSKWTGAGSKKNCFAPKTKKETRK